MDLSHVQFGLIVWKEGKVLARGFPFVMSWLAYSCRCDMYILRLTSIITLSGSPCSPGLVTGPFLHRNGLATSSCTWISHHFFQRHHEGVKIFSLGVAWSMRL